MNKLFGKKGTSSFGRKLILEIISTFYCKISKIHRNNEILKSFLGFNSFMTEVLIVDWFVYDWNLRHERVELLIYGSLDKMPFLGAHF